jgi:purine-nucleoside phosphorylase
MTNTIQMDPTFVPYRIAGSFLIDKLKRHGISAPVVGVICGSGLSGLSTTLEGDTLTVNYRDIPGFPAHCTVQGHKGEVVFGLLSGVPAMCFRGRFHSYGTSLDLK